MIIPTRIRITGIIAIISFIIAIIQFLPPFFTLDVTLKTSAPASMSTTVANDRYIAISPIINKEFSYLIKVPFYAKLNYTDIERAASEQLQKSAAFVFSQAKIIPEGQEIDPYGRSPDAKIEVIVENIELDLPYFKHLSFIAKISYKINIFNGAGALLESHQVSGSSQIRGRMGFSWSQNIDRVSSLALKNATDKMILALVRSDL